MLLLDYFLLIRGIEFLGASLIFTIRISNFFLLFLLCAQLLNKLQQTNNPTTSQGPSIYIPSKKSPEFQMSHNHRNYLQLAKPHLCQSMRQIIVSCCGQSEAAPYPTPGIKTKTYSHNITGFLKKPKFQNFRYRILLECKNVTSVPRRFMFS